MSALDGERGPRAPTRNRPDTKCLASETSNTIPAASPDMAAYYVARRYGLPMPVAALIARLAELGGALS